VSAKNNEVLQGSAVTYDVLGGLITGVVT